jgi:Tol biopolymer transport system component
VDKIVEIKKIYEKYLAHLYDGVVINNFELVRTYKLNEQKEWVDDLYAVFMTIKNNTDKQIYLPDVERKLKPLFGYEVVVNFS